MKTMTCTQLGGACNLKFQADTFEEMVEQSKRHGMEMFRKGDKEHLAAMQKMKALMQSPAEMKAWYEEKKAEFELLSPDSQSK